MARETTLAGFALAQGVFEGKPLNIPDGQGDVYKKELTVLRGLTGPQLAELAEGLGGELTIKSNIWYEPDVKRRTGAAAGEGKEEGKDRPHNHPWHFRSMIISGIYTEERYWRAYESGKIQWERKTYKEGEINEVPTDVFHLVVDVAIGTTTIMMCGKATPDNEWGYLDLETGAYHRAEKDPSFRQRLEKVNPHLRG